MGILSRLQLLMTANSTQLVGEMKKANRSISMMQKQVRTTATLMKGFAAVFGVAQIKNWGASIVAAGDKLDKLSKAVGDSPSKIDAMARAFEFSGVAGGTFTNMLERMQRRLGKAFMGQASYARAVKALGVNLDSLRTQSATEQMTTLLKAMRETGDRAIAAGAAMDIFGVDGVMAAARMVADLDGGLERMNDNLKTGNHVTDSAATAAANLTDAYTDLKQNLVPLSNGFLELANSALTTTNAFIKAWKSSGGLWEALLKIGAVSAKWSGIDTFLSPKAEAQMDKILESMGLGKDLKDLKKKVEAGGTDAPFSPDDANNDGVKNNKKQRDSIADKIAAMKIENETFLMTSKAAELYKMRIEGATEAQLKQAEALITQRDEMEKMIETRQQEAKRSEENRKRLMEEMTAAKQARDEAIAENQRKIDEASEQLKDTIQGTLGDELYGVLQGNFDNIGQAFKSMLDRMVADFLASKIMDMFSNTFGSGTGTGGGFGGLVNAVGSFFGGFKGQGGSVEAGVPYITGEYGRELFVPDVPGTIVPNHQMQSASGAPMNIVNNFTIHAPTGKLSPEMQQQVAAKAAQATQRAMMRSR